MIDKHQLFWYNRQALCEVRVQFNGRTPAFQAGCVGPIPITRSTFQSKANARKTYFFDTLCASSSAGQSTALLRRVSGVRIPSGVPQFYGGYSSVGRAPDCGSGSRGFESHYSPHLYFTLGYSQVVRHETLTLASVGSNPATPANYYLLTKYGLLAQLVEHMTFNHGVPRSNRGQVTTSGCGEIGRRIRLRI